MELLCWTLITAPSRRQCHPFMSKETDASRVTLSRDIRSSDSNVGTPQHLHLISISLSSHPLYPLYLTEIYPLYLSTRQTDVLKANESSLKVTSYDNPLSFLYSRSLCCEVLKVPSVSLQLLSTAMAPATARRESIGHTKKTLTPHIISMKMSAADLPVRRAPQEATFSTPSFPPNTQLETRMNPTLPGAPRPPVRRRESPWFSNSSSLAECQWPS